MPGPWSADLDRRSSPAVDSVTAMRVPGGVCARALTSRFATAWRSRISSPTEVGSAARPGARSASRGAGIAVGRPARPAPRPGRPAPAPAADPGRGGPAAAGRPPGRPSARPLLDPAHRERQVVGPAGRAAPEQLGDSRGPTSAACAARAPRLPRSGAGGSPMPHAHGTPARSGRASALSASLSRPTSVPGCLLGDALRKVAGGDRAPAVCSICRSGRSSTRTSAQARQPTAPTTTRPTSSQDGAQPVEGAVDARERDRDHDLASGRTDLPLTGSGWSRTRAVVSCRHPDAVPVVA